MFKKGWRVSERSTKKRFICSSSNVKRVIEDHFWQDVIYDSLAFYLHQWYPKSGPGPEQSTNLMQMRSGKLFFLFIPLWDNCFDFPSGLYFNKTIAFILFIKV